MYVFVIVKGFFVCIFSLVKLFTVLKEIGKKRNFVVTDTFSIAIRCSFIIASY